METQANAAVNLLGEVLSIDNVNQVLVIGRDGFIIESLGSRDPAQMETVGAALANAVNEMEKMGNLMAMGHMDTVTMGFGSAFAMGMATPDAVIAAVASDNASQGLMRIKMNALVPQLEQFL